ncbi:MAG: protein kinase domain-containing protein [Gemmatimonadaceae bacterium]
MDAFELRHRTPPAAPRVERSHTLADRYVVEEHLGRGGAANVYLARDSRYDRRVAVKILTPELAASIAAKRFLKEIVLTARLQHPHILTILDSGELDGLPYYVAPYLEGGSLRGRLDRDRQLTIDEALLIIREVGDALDCAHAHGIVHRDIKPDNILFAAGHACVADFGIARAIDRAGDERLTRTGIAIGTPEYMSPEQARGQPIIDARSDVYSLACMLYEMLAGVPPYVGRTPSAIIAQLKAEPPRPLSAVRSDVPQFLTDAITHAMQVKPDARTDSVRTFCEELGVPLGAAARTPVMGSPAINPATDTLTGLPKRRHFRKELDRALASGARCAVFFLDLDRFKQINDTLGHAAGDAVLCAVSERVQSVIGPDATFCRLGGDEFTILVPVVREPETLTPLAARIRDAVVQPVSFGDKEIGVSTSIGIAVAPDDAASPEELLHCADTALYAAKERGRNAFVMYRTLSES